MLRMPRRHWICHLRRWPPKKHFCKQWRWCAVTTRILLKIYSRGTSFKLARIWAIALTGYYTMLRTISAISKTYKTASITWLTWKDGSVLQFSLVYSKLLRALTFLLSRHIFSFLLRRFCALMEMVKGGGGGCWGKRRCVRWSRRRCYTIVGTVTIRKTHDGSACNAQTRQK